MKEHLIAPIYIKKTLTILLCLAVVFSMSNVPLYAGKVDTAVKTGDIPSEPLPRRDDSQAITTPQQLQAIIEDLDGEYFLEDDIDCEDIDFDFRPIGSEGEPFTGTFDGRGHTISNLTIDMPDEDNVGLFSSTDGAVIQNVVLYNIEVNGQNQVGGLIGHADDSEIINCLVVEGTITGTGEGQEIGGLVGFSAGTTITTSCTSGDITGEQVVGGLIGAFYEGIITDTYTIANVTCNIEVAGGLIGMTECVEISNSYAAGSGLDCNWAGGFIGLLEDPDESEFSNNFWDTETYSQDQGLEDTVDGNLEGIEGKTSLEMWNQNMFIDWDFENIWMMLAYPHFQIELEYSFRPIRDIEELQLIGNHDNYPLNGNYYLANDIDASGTCNWNDGRGFEPVGEYGDNPFTGILCSNGHTIRNLFINRPNEDYVGLFGWTNGVIISNIGIVDVHIVGRSSVGGLAGEARYSQIINSYATGNVSGSRNKVGGLVGYNGSGSVIIDEFGLVVDNGGSQITNSYATGNVSGRNDVGGLVGANCKVNSLITNSYATGNVSGSRDRVGRLVGWSDVPDENYRNNYYIMAPEDEEELEVRWPWDWPNPGGRGVTTQEMMQQDTFEDWDFNGTWFMPEGCFPHLQMERDEFDDEFLHHEIELPEGWNTISFNLIPDVKDMEYLIEDIEDDMIIMKNGEGDFISPGFGFYGIKKMFVKNGYQVKLEDNAVLDIYGKVPKLPMAIPLKLGWSLIGYPCQIEQSGADVLQSLILNEDLHFRVKNPEGDFVDSNWNIEDLDDFPFLPNQGYWLWVDTPVDLLIPTLEE